MGIRLSLDLHAMHRGDLDFHEELKEGSEHSKQPWGGQGDYI